MKLYLTSYIVFYNLKDDTWLNLDGNAIYSWDNKHKTIFTKGETDIVVKHLKELGISNVVIFDIDFTGNGIDYTTGRMP